jgi:hypothetical protein
MDFLLSKVQGASTVDATQVDAVYELAVTGFAELGASDPKRISRSFLLQKMCYAGQRYRCEGWQAVWLVDENSIDFYDAAGNPVKTLNLVTEMDRKAA